MLVTEQDAAATTAAQALALAKILYGGEPKPGQVYSVSKRTDRFSAHRILVYILSHLMSDEDNRRYVQDALGMAEETERGGW